MKQNEPVPVFITGDAVIYLEHGSYEVLKVSTYCLCCDRFLDEPEYALKATNGYVEHKVPESKLRFPEE
jgi:hypothetical protein